MGKIIKNSWALFTGFGIIIISHGFQGNLLGIKLEISIIIIALDYYYKYFIGFFIGATMIPIFILRVGHIRVFAAFASIASIVVLSSCCFCRSICLDFSKISNWI